MTDKEIYWSRNDEDFTYETIQDVIDCEGDLKVGDTIYYGEVERPNPEDFICVDRIIEDIGVQAYDVGGEYAEDYPEVSEEAKTRLDQLLKEWVNSLPAPTFFTIKNTKPYKLTEEDFE